MGILTSVVLQFLPACIFFYIVWKVFTLFKRRWKLQTDLKDFPGPKPSFFTGNMKQITGDYEGLLRLVGLSSQYNGAFPVWMGPFDANLICVHPSTAKHVLSGADPKDKFFYGFMHPWIGDGLLLSQGRKWDRNRRLMTPAFHVDILKSYVATFSQSAKILHEKWKSTIDVKTSVEVCHDISLLTMDSMLKCLFGHDSGCQHERTRHPYIQGVYDVSELIMKRITSPIHHLDLFYYFSRNGKKFRKACEVIHSHSEMIIRERHNLLNNEKPGSRNVDFLDILLTSKDLEGRGLSDTEIRDEVDTFMFEGHDSTASAISWCLYNLAKHPEHQELCRKEVSEIMNQTNNSINWEDLSKFEYTLMCIQESMRLYPPVPGVSRVTEKDITLSDGRVIPQGTSVAVSLFAIHRNPEIWDDPEVFDPSRFSKALARSSIHFLPFSLGPRNCIGIQFALTQIRTVIPMILRHFRLRLDLSKPAEPESLLILRSKNGIHLYIEPV